MQHGRHAAAMRPAATITVATLISIDAAGLTGDEDGDGVGGVVSRRRVAEIRALVVVGHSLDLQVGGRARDAPLLHGITTAAPLPVEVRRRTVRRRRVVFLPKTAPHRNSKHCLKTDYNKSALNLEPWHSTRRCCALAPAAAIDRYLLPAPELSSKPAAHVAVDIDRRDKQTDGQTDSRPSQRRLPSTT